MSIENPFATATKMEHKAYTDDMAPQSLEKFLIPGMVVKTDKGKYWHVYNHYSRLEGASTLRLRDNLGNNQSIGFQVITEVYSEEPFIVLRCKKPEYPKAMSVEEIFPERLSDMQRRLKDIADEIEKEIPLGLRLLIGKDRFDPMVASTGISLHKSGDFLTYDEMTEVRDYFTKIIDTYY